MSYPYSYGVVYGVYGLSVVLSAVDTVKHFIFLSVISYESRHNWKIAP